MRTEAKSKLTRPAKNWMDVGVLTIVFFFNCSLGLAENAPANQESASAPKSRACDHVSSSSEARESDRMLDDFETSGLPFKHIGTPNYNSVNEISSCNLAVDTPQNLFDALLKKMTSRMSTSNELINRELIRDVCNASYLSLGSDRFLVRYRGLGIVDFGTMKYSRLTKRWVDQDYISDVHRLGKDISVALYRETISTSGVEGNNYFALFFLRKNSDEITVKYADLGRSSAAYVDEESGIPACTDNVDESKQSSGVVSTIVSPTVRTNVVRETAVLTFILRTKDCKSGKVSDISNQFVYSKNQITDKHGKSIAIEQLMPK
jgi:hypothetical protein